MSGIETLARELYCAQEGIKYADSRDHVEYWFSEQQTAANGDVCIREEYERMAQAAISFIADAIERGDFGAGEG